jgi:hypothetical protein
MKAYRNVKEVERKEAIGRRFSLTGLGILFLGMLASFVPNWYPPGTTPPNAVAAFLQQYWALASFIALPAGFLCASIGYVVAGPCGVLLFAVRNDRGRVVINGDRWREPFSFGRLFTVFAREGVGHPPQELQTQAQKVRELLNKAPADNGADANGSPFANVPIDGAAVFLNEQAQITVESSPIPVLRGEQVKEFIRRKSKEAKLPPNTVRALTDYLRDQSTYQEVENA